MNNNCSSEVFGCSWRNEIKDTENIEFFKYEHWILDTISALFALLVLLALYDRIVPSAEGNAAPQKERERTGMKKGELGKLSKY